MTDFSKDLQAQAYLLVDDKISLEDFRLWYVANVARTPTEAPTAAKPTRKDSEFSDYYGAPYEPMDDDMRKHHRDLTGDGDP
jgi:hypothetical protein